MTTKLLKLKCNAITFAIIYSLATLILYHKPLLSLALASIDYHSFNGITILTELAIAQFLAVFLFITILSFVPIIAKPLSIIFLFTNTCAFYFISEYNVILDKNMMSNVFNTKFSEASELYNPKILLYILLMAILPSIIIAKTTIEKVSAKKRLTFIFGALLFTAIFCYANSKTWLWFDKNAKRIGGLSMPFSYTINSIRHYSAKASSNRVELKIPNSHFTNNNKTLVVLVIGESARAANFSLYGYQRNTNPLLAKDNIVALQDTKSCTTFTTESIKCMLSHQGSQASSRTLYEALPTYLQRQNINVIWRSNNWGEPKIQVAQHEEANDIREKCHDKNCDQLNYDEVLSYKLAPNLKKHLHENTFVVLHQAGSHGPLYHTKYPPQFEKFQPVCKSVELQKCTHDELINAYDNTILYTDYFLHQLIATLKSLNSSVVMIYISDHGESLGEYNFYLHGLPYSVAPSVQKEIPFIVWTSDKFKKEHNSTNQDLAKQLHHSQDNIFHSVLGAFGMKGEVYNKELDIFNK